MQSIRQPVLLSNYQMAWLGLKSDWSNIDSGVMLYTVENYIDSRRVTGIWYYKTKYIIFTWTDAMI